MSNNAKLTSIDSALVVENDQVMQRLVLNYLTDIGVRKIDCCGNGEEALQYLGENGYDLLVCDWKLKSPPSPEIYDGLRKNPKYQTLSMIFLAGTLTKSDLDIASQDAYCTFILKPFSDDVFFGAIQSATKLKVKALKEKNQDRLKALEKETALSKDQVNASKGETDSDHQLSSSGRDRQSMDLHILKGSRSSRDLSTDKGVKSNSATGDNSERTRISGQSGADGSDEDQDKIFESSTGYQEDPSFEAKQQRSSQTGRDQKIPADTESEVNQPEGFQSRLSKLGDETGKINSLSKLSADDYLERAKQISHRVAETISNGASMIEFPKSVVVVESDEAVTTLVKNYLKDMGDPEVKIFLCGKEAWESINDGSYEMVVMNWNLSGINGLALYNRIRSKDSLEQVPVLVMSGSIHEDSFRILEESVSTSFIKKPFVKSLFKKAMQETLESITLQVCINEVVDNEVEGIFADEPTLLAFVDDVVEVIQKPLNIMFEVSRLLVLKKFYETAEKVLKKAIKVDKNSIHALTELAKVYHLSDRSKDALMLLDHANKFSPGNIERLCLMGEVGLSMNDTKGAQEYFNDVLSIDEENAKGKAGILIAKNMSQHSDLPEGRGPMHRRLASSMNVVGVTYVKNKEYKKGIDQYQAAICFINDAETLSKLQFNLGLAYLRNSDESSAVKWFREAAESGGADYLKPREYLKKLGVYMAESKKLSKEEKDSAENEAGITYKWSKR